MKTLAKQGPLVIFLNGPKRSGKTTAAKHVVKLFVNSYKLTFAEPLKVGVHASLNIKKSWDYWDEREDKDTPNDEFYGLSPRQAYIKHSENYMKKIYGEEIFAKFMVKKILNHMHYYEEPIIVIADCGFQIEYDYTKIFMQRLHVIHIDKPNHSFMGDSREYIQNVKSTHFWRIKNDTTLINFKRNVYITTTKILQNDAQTQKRRKEIIT